MAQSQTRSKPRLTKGNAMAHTDHAPGEGWGRVGKILKTSLFTCSFMQWQPCKHRGYEQARKFLKNLTRFFFRQGKFRFQLKKTSGFFLATGIFFFGILRLFLAAGMLRFFFGTAVRNAGGSYRLLCGAFLGNIKKRNRLHARTIAVNLVYAYAHRGREQRDHPDPCERFFYCCRHCLG